MLGLATFDSPLVVWALFMAYFIPSIVACVLRHRQVGWLFALNLFLGWTLVIWVVCLGWAVTPEKDSSDGECG